MASKFIFHRLFCSKVKEPGSKSAKETKKNIDKTDTIPEKLNKVEQDQLDAKIVVPKEFTDKVEEVIVSCKKIKVHTGKYVPYQVNVSLQGVQCRAGKMASLLLSHNPLIKKLALYDKKDTDSLASDLSDIDKSTTVVKSYNGEASFEHAFSAADIAVLIDTDRKHEVMKTKLESSFHKVKQFAEKCAIYCPRATLIICVDPLCCTMPLIQRIFEETPWFHPGKLIGNICTIQCALNSIAGRFLNLDPTSIHIPIIGGPDAHSVVPLISQMSPDPGLNYHDQIRLYELIKSKLLKSKKSLTRVPSTINEAYSIAKMVSTVAKGLCGIENVNASAFIRTNLAPQVSYLVSTIKIGRNGICHNYGMPKLSPFEAEQLLCAMKCINDNEVLYKEMWYKEIEKPKLDCSA